MIALVTYRNIFPGKRNNRLLAYYHFLDKQGLNPCFFFIKGTASDPAYRIHNFQSSAHSSSFIQSIWQALRYFRTDKAFKTIYLYDSSALCWPLLHLWKKQNRKIVIERTELHQVDEVSGFKQHLLKWLYQADEKRNRFPLVVISEKMEKHFGPRLGGDIHRLPAFVEGAYFTTEPPERSVPNFRVAYLGTFGQKDNVEGIVRALRQAAETLPDLQFHLYGACSEAIKKHLISLSGSVPLTFHGLLDYEGLNRELQKNDLLISNRNGSTYSQYGFPTKLIEYMASGVPVISTPGSAVQEVLGKNEAMLLHVLPDFSADALGRAIRERYAHYAKWNAMGQRGRLLILESFNTRLLDEWWHFVK